MNTRDPQALIEKLKNLPPERVAEVEDFVDFLANKETLDVLSDVDLMKQIRRSLEEIAAGKPALSFEKVFGEPLEPRRKKRRR